MCLNPSRSRNRTAIVSVAAGQDDRLIDPVAEQRPVGQTGQKIMLCRMRDLQRHRAGQR